jgi:hypothetical protein
MATKYPKTMPEILIYWYVGQKLRKNLLNFEKFVSPYVLRFFVGFLVFSRQKSEGVGK